MINGSVKRIYCRGSLGNRGVSAKNNRLFLEAVLWIARTGAPWRDLPESFAHWPRVYVRYNRWSHKVVWNRVFAAVIPGRKNRVEERDYDKIIDKERNQVERLFQKLKHYRRIATRYERLARNYLAMLSLVAIIIWLLK